MTPNAWKRTYLVLLAVASALLGTAYVLWFVGEIATSRAFHTATTVAMIPTGIVWLIQRHACRRRLTSTNSIR